MEDERLKIADQEVVAASMRRSNRTVGATLVVARQTGRHETGPYERT